MPDKNSPSDDRSEIKTLVAQLEYQLGEAKAVHDKLLTEHKVYCNFYHGPNLVTTYLPDKVIAKRTTTETFS